MASPAHVIRIGRLNGSIWENVKNGRSWYSVTFSKSYEDEEGKTCYGQSFDASDLLLLSELSRQTYLWAVRRSGSKGLE